MNPTRNKIIETLNGINTATKMVELAAVEEGFGNDIKKYEETHGKRKLKPYTPSLAETSTSLELSRRRQMNPDANRETLNADQREFVFKNILPQNSVFYNLHSSLLTQKGFRMSGIFYHKP